MEESSSCSSIIQNLNLIILRPLLAIVFVLSLILICWVLAWTLVLVHVPLVQEICGLRKKPKTSKPLTRRYGKLYSTIDANNSASIW